MSSDNNQISEIVQMTVNSDDQIIAIVKGAGTGGQDWFYIINMDSSDGSLKGMFKVTSDVANSGATSNFGLELARGGNSGLITGLMKSAMFIGVTS